MKKDRKRQRRCFLIGAAAVLTAAALSTGAGETDKVRPAEVQILISLGGDNGNKAYYEELIGQFNRDVAEVCLVPSYAESDSHAILKLLYSGQTNQSYDIACLGAPQITTLIDMKLIQPLDQYVMRDLGVGWLNSIPPIRMAGTVKDGSIYSLPFFRTNTVLYCNEALISWAGEEITTAGMLRLAETYHGGGGGPGLLLAADQLVLDLLAAGEGEMILPAGERAETLTVDGEEQCRLAEQIRRLLRDGGGISYKTNDGRALNAFFDGRVPLLEGSSCHEAQIRMAAEFSVRVVPLKINDKKDYPVNGSNLYLIHHSGSGEPAWAAILRLLELAEDGMPEHPAVGNSYSRMAVHQNSKVQRLMEMAVLRMWREDTDTGEILKQLQAQVDDILKEGE